MKKIVSRKVFIISLVLFIPLFMSIFLGKATVDGMYYCISSLDGHPSAIDDYYDYVEYLGWPLTFMTVTKDGCFDYVKKDTQIDVSHLLVDLLMVICVSALPLGISLLTSWLRSRRKDSTSSAESP